MPPLSRWLWGWISPFGGKPNRNTKAAAFLNFLCAPGVLCGKTITLPHMFSTLIQTLAGWLPRRRSLASPQAGKHPEPAQAAAPQPALQLFVPDGNCARCRNYRVRVADSRGKEFAQNEARAAICNIRGMELHEPLTTYCKNFSSADGDSPNVNSPGTHAPGSNSMTFHPANIHPANGALFGATYSILPAHSGMAVPWVDLAVPRVAPATCCMCGEHSETGIVIALQLPEGHVDVECCGPQHYLDWWTDYLLRCLAYFKLLGERAYSDMYDVVLSSSATAHYSNAKEAFYSAISTARDLELTAEQQALEDRLAHIKAVFRSQFR